MLHKKLPKENYKKEISILIRMFQEKLMS